MITDRNVRHGFFRELASCAPLWVSLLICLPAAVFFGNPGEFSSATGTLFTWLLVLCLGASAATALLCRLLPSSLPARLQFALLLLGALTWIQGNLLVGNYGPFDGRAIDFGGQWIAGVVDSLVWLLVLAVAFFNATKIISNPFRVAVYLLLVQGASLAAILVTSAPLQPENRRLEVSTESRFTFSSTSNVVLIVLDEYQSDVFAEIIDADPELRRVFNGFTFFPDALAAASFTQLALPALLTGQLYDNSLPRQDFLRSSFQKHSIFRRLKDRQYIVDVYPWANWAEDAIYLDAGIADNVRQPQLDAFATLTHKRTVKETARLLDLSLFRALPHWLKSLVFAQNQWLLQPLLRSVVPRSFTSVVSDENQYEVEVFARKFSDQIAIGGNRPVFKFYHLKGNHVPLTVNSDLELTTETFDYTRDNYRNQMKNGARALGHIFGAMRSAGIFDSSLIVISGDHGSGRTSEMQIPGTRGPGKIADQLASTYQREFAFDKTRALPVLLIKRANASGPVRSSAYPVSTADIPELIVDALVNTGGHSAIYDGIDPGRVRSYAAFDLGQDDDGYLGPIWLYSVSGNADNDKSWEASRVQAAAQ